MPIHTYSEKVKLYECIQYDGTNYAEIAAFAPMIQEDGKVYLVVPGIGNIEIKATDWVMKDIWELFSAMSDVYFQRGYKPGGGPAPTE